METKINNSRGYAVGVTQEGETKLFKVINRHIDCSRENLISLDLSNAKGLRVLSCSRNHLETLSLEGLTDLKFLNCSNNRLTKLDCRGLGKIDRIACCNNPLPLCNQDGKDWIIKRAKENLLRKNKGVCFCLRESILDYNKSHECCISDIITDTFPKFTYENAEKLFSDNYTNIYWWKLEDIAVRLEFLDFINS